MHGVGEIVRVKSRSDLGEISVVAIERDVIYVDTGWRIDGKMISVSWPQQDLISLEDYPAWLADKKRRSRQQTQDSVQRHWNKTVRRGAA